MDIRYGKLERKDAQALWDMMSALDSETKFMLYEPGERVKDIARIENLIDSAANGENFLLAAMADGEIVGYLSAQKGNLLRIRHSAMIVVGIRKRQQGRGIGTELFRRLDAWAREVGVTRLELVVRRGNEAARRLYEKSGFVLEGTKRQSIWIDGAYEDEYYMAKSL